MSHEANVELYPVAKIDQPHALTERRLPTGTRFTNRIGALHGNWKVVGFGGYIEKYSAWVIECVHCGYTKEIRSNTLCYEHSGVHRKCNCVPSRYHPLHGIWTGMHQRCVNKNLKHYDRYGGRGITVCKRWNSFQLFCEDMGERPGPEYSIDRIDNDGNYEPTNCRWATAQEQIRNSSIVREITFNGETKIMSDWAADIGVTRERMRQRLVAFDAGRCTLEEALKTPKGVTPQSKLQAQHVRERQMKERKHKALERLAEVVSLIDGQVHTVELDSTDIPPSKVVDAIRSLSADCTTRIIDNCVMFKATPPA